MGRRWFLLCVTGLSPQIVTETLWALAQKPEWSPPEAIRLITTEEGAGQAAALLPAALAELSGELGVTLPAPVITLIRAPDGRALRDVETEEDNIAAADIITAEIRRATADPDVDLHVSIAGGRKTLGCLAAMALSLFGRPGDRLSHVLVPFPFQGRPDFFFPSRTPRLLPRAGGPPLNTQDCRVVLADIPFVRLRGIWKAEQIAESYAAAVHAVQEALTPAELVIDVPRREVRYGRMTRQLPPSLLGTLLWLARRRRTGGGPVHGRNADTEDWLACIIEAAGDPAHRSVADARRAFRGDGTAELLAEKVSRLNRIARETLGPEAPPYLIRREGRRPYTGYQLATPADAITIIPEGKD